GAYPLLITFDASRSSSGIVEYLWSFGDGTTGSGLTVSHTYTDRGTYTAFLTVTAQNGDTAQAEVAIVVHSKKPVAKFTFSPATDLKVDEMALFDASASHDPDGTVAEYLWDFGDGSWTSTSLPTTHHIYGEEGEYIVTLVVKDNEGDTSDPYPGSIWVIRGGCCGKG
ncbi:MAG: PKD domain-containing protein, partial [Candidatus Bipolaricaulis anaerobius]|nr:PKD domain-containing protein [Candidatus Bipolaricaulis anaerobius]